MCWKGAQGLELDLGLPSNGSGMLTKPLPLQRLISSFMKGERRYLSYSQELRDNKRNEHGLYISVQQG